LVSSTSPRILLLVPLTWISVTTVYRAWLNLHRNSILKMETKCFFETSVFILTKPHGITTHKNTNLIHTTHKTSHINLFIYIFYFFGFEVL
jgi:hypothetical protein